MNCMRCGQEIAPGQVFCDDCRAVMKKYPVNPDTPVHLPRRQQAASPKKQPKKRTISAEEQLAAMKKRLRFFVIWSLISTALAAALLYPAVQYWMTDHFKVGQNYSSYTVPVTTETTPD